MRSDWGPEAIYLAVDFGPWGPNGGGHSHADYGSVNVFAYGNDLVVDPCCGEYGQPTHRWVDRAPQAHNAIMIDGVGQKVGPTPGRPGVFKEPIHTWVTNRVFDAGWGSYHFDSLGLDHSRIVWFAKPGYFLLVDTLQGQGTHKVRQNFTLAPSLSPVVEGNAARTAETGKANILILPADHRPAPDIRTGEIDKSDPANPFYEGWVMWDNRYERIPAPAVVYNFQTRFPAGMETVLYPTPAGVKAEVAVARRQSKGDTGAVLVTVTMPEATDKYIIARSGGRHEFPEAAMVFEGRIAMVRIVDGKPTAIGLLGGTLLEAEGLKVAAEVPTDASIEFSGGKWRIGDGKRAVTLFSGLR